jgi:hypothetical protein
LIDQIQQQNGVPVIPSQSNKKAPRNYDEHLYKERHLTECFYNKTKHLKHISSHFGKKASSFAGFLAYAFHPLAQISGQQHTNFSILYKEYECLKTYTLEGNLGLNLFYHHQFDKIAEEILFSV